MSDSFVDNRSELQVALDLYNDMYKDMHGVRPRWIYSMGWTLLEVNERIDRLQAEIDYEIKQEREKELAQAEALGVDLETYRRWERKAPLPWERESLEGFHFDESDERADWLSR